MSRHPLCSLLLLPLALGCGCPNAEPEPGPPPTQPAPLSSTTAPTPEPARPVAPEPPDPVGPARPMPRTPRPDDGRSQVHQLGTHTISLGSVALEVWLADQPDRRTLGLMHVRDLPEDRGMLFVYPDSGRRSFWMKNTYVPLSLGYIAADGSLEQILDMAPHDLTSHPSRTSVQFVLEVNQGWFERHGVAEGVRVGGLSGLRGF